MATDKKKVGRPRLELDEVLIEKLAGLHCTMIEIASMMKCSVDTLENNYSEIIKRGRDSGKVSLKRKQYEVAMQGNVSMLIWLGKQHLGQTEKVETKAQSDVTMKDERDARIDRLVAMFNDTREKK